MILAAEKFWSQLSFAWSTSSSQTPTRWSTVPASFGHPPAFQPPAGEVLRTRGPPTSRTSSEHSDHGHGGTPLREGSHSQQRGPLPVGGPSVAVVAVLRAGPAVGAPCAPCPHTVPMCPDPGSRNRITWPPPPPGCNGTQKSRFEFLSAMDHSFSAERLLTGKQVEERRVERRRTTRRKEPARERFSTEDPALTMTSPPRVTPPVERRGPPQNPDTHQTPADPRTSPEPVRDTGASGDRSPPQTPVLPLTLPPTPPALPRLSPSQSHLWPEEALEGRTTGSTALENAWRRRQPCGGEP
ncbi:unnamed protein product [Boreogadus saida]